MTKNLMQFSSLAGALVAAVTTLGTDGPAITAAVQSTLVSLGAPDGPILHAASVTLAFTANLVATLTGYALVVCDVPLRKVVGSLPPGPQPAGGRDDG